MDKKIKYVFNNGEVVLIEDFKIPSDEYFFKVNLPSSKENYVSGNGEGVWACTDLISYKKYQEDKNEGIIYVKILNDSVYYNGLNCEDLIPVELRGEKRPVAIYEELLSKYGESNRKNLINNIYGI